MQNIAEDKFFKSIILLIIFIFLSVFFYFVFNSYAQTKNKSSSTILESSAFRNDSGLPTRLIIPSINIDALIQYVGLAPDGSIGVPDGPYNVAWFDLSSRPGQQGSAIITGHYGPWKNGIKSVFDNLYKLKVGDKIYVKDDMGKLISFTMKSSKIYNLNASVPDLFNKNDGVYLDLITCNGTWIQDKETYTNRLVIFAQ